jgi:hypothetical protein
MATAAASVGENLDQQQAGGSSSTAVVLPPTRNLAPARKWFAEPCMLGVGEDRAIVVL